MAYFWNLIYFFFFVWFKSFYTVINYLNPITYILMIPFVKRAFAKKGYEDFNQYWDNQAKSATGGIILNMAGIQMGGLIICLGFAIFNLLQFFIQFRIFDPMTNHGGYFAIFCAVILILSFVINHYVLFKEDRYLPYFKKFEKMEPGSKWKYGWMCFAIVLCIYLSFFFSFSVLKYIS